MIGIPRKAQKESRIVNQIIFLFFLSLPVNVEMKKITFKTHAYTTQQIETIQV